MPNGTAINEKTLHNLKGIIIVDHAVGIAIEFGCRDGGVAVTGVEQGDANHQGAGEAPGVTLCDGE